MGHAAGAARTRTPRTDAGKPAPAPRPPAVPENNNARVVGEIAPDAYGFIYILVPNTRAAGDVNNLLSVFAFVSDVELRSTDSETPSW